MPSAASNGRSLRELLVNPDQWVQTRSRIRVLGYADHWLNSQFSDAELKQWLPNLSKQGLKLGLEVGAVKPWGRTGAKAFDIGRRMWDRFRLDGGNIYALAMDEPLSAVRRELHESNEYAVEQTAQFMALVRKEYPDVLVGDIEPYPSLERDELISFIDALQHKLQELNVRGLDFFRVDVDWMHFVYGNAVAWPRIKEIENACRQRGIRFGLIYWAADYPQLDRMHLADDSTWYVSIMQQGYDYAAVGGTPDQYVIESWLEAPQRTLPEGGRWTLTRSALDFTRKFVGHEQSDP